MSEISLPLTPIARMASLVCKQLHVLVTARTGRVVTFFNDDIPTRLNGSFTDTQSETVCSLLEAD